MGGLLSCRTFVSHMTGFASMASLEFESNQAHHAISLLAMLLIFLFGAMMSGVLIDSRIRENKKPRYYIAFGFLFIVMLFVTIGGFNNIFGEFGVTARKASGYSLVALLCFTCGVQNGMITLVSKSVVRTTHLTGLVTDLGIGFVRILNRSRAHSAENEGRANGMRIGIVLSFFFGSLIGVPIFRNLQFRGFVFPCLIYAGLFALTSYFTLIRNRQ